MVHIFNVRNEENLNHSLYVAIIPDTKS
jgi:hypothetical protein